MNDGQERLQAQQQAASVYTVKEMTIRSALYGVTAGSSIKDAPKTHGISVASMRAYK